MRDVQQELKPTPEKYGWYTSNFLSLADFTNSPFLGGGGEYLIIYCKQSAWSHCRPTTDITDTVGPILIA